ncbi:MAG TPA: Arm DNA-binding domain-containing protein, partial [Cyclobacteriaceae bacterium]|nr:Arm DNA-binding domain-containing protein [Cyclobacteriaceae bacterium]
MATTKAVIRRNRINGKSLTPIYIRYTHRQRSILFAVGQMINTNHWNDNGFVRKSMRGYTNINALIEKKKRSIDDLRINLQLNDIEPTIENVKKAFNKKYNKIDFEVKESPYFLDHWDKFAEFQVNITRISPGTTR